MLPTLEAAGEVSPSAGREEPESRQVRGDPQAVLAWAGRLNAGGKVPRRPSRGLRLALLYACFVGYVVATASTPGMIGR